MEEKEIIENENESETINNEQKLKMRAILFNMDTNNRNCVDCGKASMDYASINNGIVICSSCAKEHKKLGNSISFLRNLGDQWDDYLFNYLKEGGNSRFLQFLKNYKINTKQISEKYKTKGVEYYREILKSEILGYDPPDNIEVKSAGKNMDRKNDVYTEFDYYNFVKHYNKNKKNNFYVRQKKKEINENENKEKGFLDSIGDFFSNIQKKVVDIANNFEDNDNNNKMDENNVIGDNDEVFEIYDNNVKIDPYNYFIGDDGIIQKMERKIVDEENIDKNNDNINDDEDKKKKDENDDNVEVLDKDESTSLQNEICIPKVIEKNVVKNNKKQKIQINFVKKIIKKKESNNNNISKNIINSDKKEEKNKDNNEENNLYFAGSGNEEEDKDKLHTFFNSYVLNCI